MKKTFLFLGGVLVPLLSSLVELVTGIGSETLFDPFANWLMIPAVLSVPTILFFYWLWRRNPDETAPPAWLAPALGWCIGISAYYVLIIGPFAFPAIIGILFGVGLIALSPVFTIWAALIGSVRVARSNQSSWSIFAGLALSGAFLFFVEMPSWVTVHYLSQLRSNPGVEELENTVSTLERFGSAAAARRLHNAGFRKTEPALFAMNWAMGNCRVDQRNAALAYYRMTGNSVTRPKSNNHIFDRTNARTRWGTFDNALGGDEVARQIEGLALYQSLLEAEVEPDLQLIRTNWTLELRNINPNAQEGRFHVVLPPGSFVSGLHLWVNGEPRPAAFAEKSKVTKAYRSVAVVRKRDPVLVRWAGPDRLFVQCFPVPANGGTIKFKIEYLSETGDGTIVAPHISDRNFQIESSFRHELNYRSKNPFTSQRELMQIAKRPLGGNVLMALLPDHELTHNSPLGTVELPTPPTQLWTENPYLTDKKDSLLIRTLASPEEQWEAPATSLILLLDSSSAVRKERARLIPLIDAIPDGTILSVAAATTTGPDFVFESGPLTEQKRNKIRLFLNNFGTSGGVDNGPTLRTIIEQSEAETATKILWVHGHQPVEFNTGTSKTILKRAAIRPKLELHSLSVKPGSNYLIQALVESPVLRSAGRLSDDPESQLERILKPHSERYRWEHVSRKTQPDKNTKWVDSELAQQWAFLTSMQSHREGSWTKEDTQLAAQHRIVTPFTGAVVLETAAQFEEFGLNPNDPAAPKTTAVPEPEFYLMLCLILIAFAAKRFLNRPAYA